MSYIEGFSREQTLLLPEVLDDYVTEDNPVRFIDAYVGELNLVELDLPSQSPKKRGVHHTIHVTCSSFIFTVI